MEKGKFLVDLQAAWDTWSAQRQRMAPSPLLTGLGGIAGIVGGGLGGATLRGRSIFEEQMLAMRTLQPVVSQPHTYGPWAYWQFKNGKTVELPDEWLGESLPEGTLKCWDRSLGAMVFYAR